MNGAVTYPTNYSEIVSRMVSRIFIYVMNMESVVAGVSTAARLADKIRFIPCGKAMFSIFCGQTVNALPINRRFVMGFTIKRGPSHQWFWAHRTLTDSAGISSFSGRPFSFPSSAWSAFCKVWLMLPFSTSYTQAAAKSVDLHDGVVVNASNYGGGNAISVRRLYCFNNLGAVNLRSSRHGLSSFPRSPACDGNVHVGIPQPRNTAEAALSLR